MWLNHFIDLLEKKWWQTSSTHCKITLFHFGLFRYAVCGNHFCWTQLCLDVLSRHYTLFVEHYNQSLVYNLWQIIAIILPLTVIVVFYFIRRDVYDLHQAVLGMTRSFYPSHSIFLLTEQIYSQNCEVSIMLCLLGRPALCCAYIWCSNWCN